MFLSGADDAIRQFIYNSRNTPNPSLALQIAFQGYLTSCCARIVGYWHPDGMLNSVFEDLYEAMRLTGEVYGTYSKAPLLSLNLFVFPSGTTSSRQMAFLD
jgi:hypothetical protein